MKCSHPSDLVGVQSMPLGDDRRQVERVCDGCGAVLEVDVVDEPQWGGVDV